MNNTILIKNALILNPNNFEDKKQSLLIKDDLIAEISDEIDESNVDKIIDAEGKILLPAGIYVSSFQTPFVLVSRLLSYSKFFPHLDLQQY